MLRSYSPSTSASPILENQLGSLSLPLDQALSPALIAGAERAQLIQRRQLARGRIRLLVLSLLALAACAFYLLHNLDFQNPERLAFALNLRLPKLIVMVITAFAIGGASLVFQSVIRNNIVTPCLLGMNSLYTLIHTAVVFVLGSGSVLVLNQNYSFFLDIVLMGVIATFIYSYLFKKTRHNVLYVLLVGTILTSFFGSLQSAMTRLMDPNEYDALLSSLVASFYRSNTKLISFGLILIGLILIFCYRQLRLLDVITMGRDVAINLGVPYERCVQRLMLGVVLCIAVATAMVGPISFLGLILANLARQCIQGYRHSQLIPASALFGVIALVGGQSIVEQYMHYAVPISVFITVGGGIYFLYLILTRKSLS